MNEDWDRGKGSPGSSRESGFELLSVTALTFPQQAALETPQTGRRGLSQGEEDAETQNSLLTELQLRHDCPDILPWLGTNSMWVPGLGFAAAGRGWIRPQVAAPVHLGPTLHLLAG